MAAFSKIEISEWALDYQLLTESSINFYYKQEVLNPDLEYLKNKGYRIEIFNCLDFQDQESFGTELSKRLSFWATWNRNLDALNDFMRDLEEEQLAIVFLGFEKFLGMFEEYEILSILDIFDGRSRELSIAGKRFITILQTNKPAVAIEGIGCTYAKWNRKEHLYKDRDMTKPIEIKTFKLKRR